MFDIGAALGAYFRNTGTLRRITELGKIAYWSTAFWRITEPPTTDGGTAAVLQRRFLWDR
jgi:hypothetical protein